jgi:hypothetical protein
VKDIGEHDVLTPGDIEALVRDVLARAGLSNASAAFVARSIRRAEIAGLRKLGLGLVPHMVEHLRCGRVSGAARPHLTETSTAALLVEADGGFACPAIETGLTALGDRAQDLGIAALSVRNAYPVGSGLPFLDYCSARGLVGIASIAGLVTRGGASGTLMLEIERRSLGFSRTSLATVLPIQPDPAMAAAALPPFEGPLGAPFGLHHCFVAIRADIWPTGQSHAPLPDTVIQNSGIAVSAGLLEKIINA